jgi:outer membrane autotransporter barrel domain
MKKRLWRRKVATILGVGGVLLFQSSALAALPAEVINSDVAAGSVVTGTDAHGIVSTAVPVLVGSGVSVVINGTPSIGTNEHAAGIALQGFGGPLTIGDGLSVTMTMTSAKSDGTHASGILANTGTLTAGDNVTVTSIGEMEAKGLFITGTANAEFGDGLKVEVTSTDGGTTANNEGAKAIISSGSAELKIGDNLDVVVDSDWGIGIYQDANGKTTTIGDSATITTTGINSKGIESKDGGTVEFEGGATISSSGAQSTVTVHTLNGGQVFFNGDTSISSTNATGEDRAIVSYQSNSKIATVGTNKLTINGSIIASDSGEVDLTFGAGSTFTGAAKNDVGFGVGTLALDMTDTTWNLTGDSELDTLNLNVGSKVDFQGTGDWTLNVTNLGGDGNGEIHMRADTTAGTGDFLSVTNLNSNQGIFITDTSGNVGGAASLSVASITNDHGNVLNLLNPGGVVDAGAFQYDLQDTGSGAYDLVQTGQLSTTATYVPNIVRTVYYTNYVETNSLMKRMGDLRSNSDSGNVWARGFVGQINADARGNLGEYKQNYHGFQVGMDKKISSNEVRDIYVGGHLGYTSSNNDYRAAGNGDTTSYYGGVYGTYHRPNTGFYVDGVLKVGSVKHEQEIVQSGLILAKDSDRASAWALSFEAGQRFFFGNGKAERQGFYLEPQAKLAVAQTGDYSFNLAGTQVDVENDTSFMSRLGFLAGYEVKKGKNPINVYGKLSWVKEYGNDLTTTVSGVTLKDSMSDNWWAYGLGATAKIGERHNLYLDLERASGGNFTQDWQVTGGYRFQW